MNCSVENRKVSNERIKEFTNITSEAAWEIKDCISIYINCSVENRMISVERIKDFTILTLETPGNWPSTNSV